MKLFFTKEKLAFASVIRCFLLITLVFLSLNESIAQCNGSLDLCGRRYNEVACLTTHNAFNCADGGFQYPNQNYTLTNQMNNGVRGLMLDVHNLLGVPTVYHGTFVLGSQPFSANLNEIKAFLDTHPNEIVTIILECYVSANAIETCLSDAGLMPLLFAKDSTQPWPTLQEMITDGKRLVIFTDVNDASPTQPWYHYVWDFAVETHYDVNDTAGFTSDFNRGDSLNELFILNHFVTNSVLGYGSATDATIANANPFFMNRVNTCIAEKNKFPNFVTVDFYELGNAMDVVNTLNTMNWYAIPENLPVANEITLYPNPAIDHFAVCPGKFPDFTDCSVKIFDLAGREVFCREIKQPPYTVSLPATIKNGFYLVGIFHPKQSAVSFVKLLVQR
jgi:hypothetical protein